MTYRVMGNWGNFIYSKGTVGVLWYRVGVL